MNFRFLAVLLLTLCGSCLLAVGTPAQAQTYWKPVSPLSWQIQFSGNIDTTVNASVYDLDAFDTPASLISSLHAQGRKVICSFSAGSVENWRSDSGLFPTSTLGTLLGSGENWVDIRNSTVVSLMEARLAMAQGKGCDGVALSNVDEYSYSTGFGITWAQQVSYNTLLATQAHSHGLSVGLVNDTAQIASLVSAFDYAINDSCYDYSQCNLLAPFTAANKPVFDIEYNATTAQFCPSATQAKLNAIRKNPALDAYVAACPLPASMPSYWKPALVTRWDIQFSGTLDTSSNADVYDIDLFDTPTATISSLHSQGKKVICYFSAGSYENWRPDASSFPASVLGLPLDGWPGENWLDVSNLSVLAPIMEARLNLAKSKGCDGIDPDNIDTYTNNSGFPLTAAEQITYNTFLANQAHARGLAIGLKNDLLQIPQLVGVFDYEINESCYDYSECSMLNPFIAAGKPVFNIEYAATTAQFCPAANQENFNSIRKNQILDAYVAYCR